MEVALVTAAVARGLDDDLPALSRALVARGADHEIVDWDDPGVDWAAVRLAVVRSVWDFPRRRGEFLAWAHRTARVTAVANPPAMLDWSGDKRYLGDLAAARRPMPAALVLDERLANWSGGRRYTCPSYEVERIDDGVRMAVPGFQPFAVYDVVMANLVPGVRRADAPGSSEEVLRWTGTPLATKEVAVVRDIPQDAAREELGRVAVEEHVGADGLWTLPAP